MAKDLSIVIITYNRSDQVVEALDSCLKCKLPNDTEVIIYDNASTDNTKDVISGYIQEHQSYNIKYYLSESNLGVGGGRSAAFDKCNGKYVYFLDDDAIIQPEYYDTFFVKPLDYLNRNICVASLTTAIDDRFDERLFSRSRTETNAKMKIDGLPVISMYHGGSHFLRKEYFDSPLYYEIKYGMEELAPSIKAMDKGYYHVLDRSISVYHNPKVNKWQKNSNLLIQCQFRYCVNTYATNSMLYPKIFKPLVYVSLIYRLKKYKKLKYAEVIQEASLLKRNIHDKRVSVKTVLMRIKLFGFSVL